MIHKLLVVTATYNDIPNKNVFVHLISHIHGHGPKMGILSKTRRQFNITVRRKPMQQIYQSTDNNDVK